MIMDILESVRLSNPSDEVKTPPQIIWKHIAGDHTGAKNPDYDDSDWQTDIGTIRNTTWNLVWFRAEWKVPLLLDGSNITFRYQQAKAYFICISIYLA